MIKKMVCIVCPLGCQLEVNTEDRKVISVSGNTCIRGKRYAETECTAPMRTVTSTVRCEDGGLVAVKTESPIPKEKMLDCIKIINNCTAYLPIRIGDVIIDNVFGSRIIATQNKD